MSVSDPEAARLVSLVKVSLTMPLAELIPSATQGKLYTEQEPKVPFEAFWHLRRTDANVHLIWSPLAARSGADGWQTHSQIALFVDRALYVKLFRPRNE